MQRLKKCLFPLSLMLLIPFFHLMFYEPLNNSNRGVFSLVTDIDKVIPFVKFFIVPYASWYIFIFLALGYFCLKDRSTYYKTMITYVIGLMVCYLTYYLFQTTVPRPELIGNDVFTRMIWCIYASDQPFNAFPSIHSFASYIMIKAINNSAVKNVQNSLVIKGVAVTIILSTLFVKQHVVLDALAGILLGEVIFTWVYNFNGITLRWSERPYLKERNFK